MKIKLFRTCVSLAFIIALVLLLAGNLQNILLPRIKDGDRGCGVHKRFQIWCSLRSGISPVLSVLIHFATVHNLTITRPSHLIIQVEEAPQDYARIRGFIKSGYFYHHPSEHRMIKIALLSNPVKKFVSLQGPLSTKKLREALDKMSDEEIRQKNEEFSVFSILGNSHAHYRTHGEVQDFITWLEAEYQVIAVTELVDESLLVLRSRLCLSFADITCVTPPAQRDVSPDITLKQIKRLKRLLWRDVIVYKHFFQKLKTLSQQITTVNDVLKFHQAKSDLRNLRSVFKEEKPIPGLLPIRTHSICLGDFLVRSKA